MALSSLMVWEVRTTGNGGNGGGFKQGATGTDRSQSDTAWATLTTASVVHTTTSQLNVSAGDYTVNAADVGNVVQITGGTATNDFFEITAVDVPNNRWTVDRSLGTAAQTCPGMMGGAVASLGALGKNGALGASGGGNKIWVKSGTYTLTTATANASGGPLQVWTFAAGLNIEGYQTTRGDRAARPVISAGSVTSLSSGLLYGGGSRGFSVTNMECDANNGTGNTVGFGGTAHYYKCTARNVSVTNGNGFMNVGAAYNCLATACYNGFGTNAAAMFCVAVSCTSKGFDVSIGAALPAVRCVAIGCATGFQVGGSKLSNCVAYNSTGAGFSCTTASGGTAFMFECIAYGNATYGFRSDTAGTLASTGHYTVNCAAGSNSSSNFSFTTDESPITLSVDPFTNAAGGDFSLNNTAGGGTSLRGAGHNFGDGITYNQADYRDVGATQHQDTGGGSSGPIAQLKSFGRGAPY